ncbi:MAG: tetratricopeptide repeat protein [Alphaproteobacteria bacterium]|nr:tetratricopeptide repeat protein [Alphaproteobacteria bacterium]MCL2757863.1 tetratricopeptide repeat protein [Alphaproteobacteria bacterium]
MKSMLEKFKKNKTAVPAQKKTLSDHAEDALYREVNEEVQAQQMYDFIRKYLRVLVAVAALAVVVVVALQLSKAQNAKTLRQSASAYESAIMMLDAGNPVAAREALVRAARSSSGGMADLALFSAARIDLQMGDSDAGVAKLEQLVRNGRTRDFRDLALVKLAMMRAEHMTGRQFEQFLAPVQTKRSPFYYTGMLLVAKKYLSVGEDVAARRWLDRITSDRGAPPSVVAEAEMLR